MKEFNPDIQRIYNQFACFQFMLAQNYDVPLRCHRPIALNISFLEKYELIIS